MEHISNLLKKLGTVVYEEEKKGILILSCMPFLRFSGQFLGQNS